MESPLEGKLIAGADLCYDKILCVDDVTLLNATVMLCVLLVSMFIGQ